MPRCQDVLLEELHINLHVQQKACEGYYSNDNHIESDYASGPRFMIVWDEGLMDEYQKKSDPVINISTCLMLH